MTICAKLFTKPFTFFTLWGPGARCPDNIYAGIQPISLFLFAFLCCRRSLVIVICQMSVCLSVFPYFLSFCFGIDVAAVFGFHNTQRNWKGYLLALIGQIRPEFDNFCTVSSG